MGSGNSKTPVIGLPVNPRVDNAEDDSKKLRKPVLIDAPSLVKLPHGTVRYRFMEGQGETPMNEDRREHPHEGPERSTKHGYFYHSTLNDFSENASYDKEQGWKFAYVYKGPTKAKQKKLYYVFGKGMKVNENGLIVPKYKPQGKGYEWPELYKEHGHVYYDMVFMKQDEELDDDDEEIIEEQPDSLTLTADHLDTVLSVVRRLAVKLLKPVGSIHLYLRNTQLSQLGVTLASLREPSDGEWKKFRIHFKSK